MGASDVKYDDFQAEVDILEKQKAQAGSDTHGALRERARKRRNVEEQVNSRPIASFWCTTIALALALALVPVLALVLVRSRRGMLFPIGKTKVGSI